MSYTQNADWSRCTDCGECLMRCPVMKMEKEEARREINLLRTTGEPKRIFDECTFCFNCNSYCPEGLRPHELILEKITEARKKKGKVSAILPYLFNGMEQSMWNEIYHMLTPEENAILDKWSEMPPPSKEILWVGCIGRISCTDIDNSSVLAELPKFGPRELCCGELAYRLGSWEAYSATIEKTLRVFEKLKIQRMVCYCGSCYNYLSNILTNVYGRDLPFELISLYEWLDEKVKGGSLKPVVPMQLDTAMHESCYITELGEGFAGSLRHLYENAGATIRELPHCGSDNLSCGAVSVLRTLNLNKSLFKEQRRKFREVKSTGVKEVALNCPGCFITLSFTHRLAGVKLHYMPEKLLETYGDTITRPLAKRINLFVRAFLKRPGLVFKKVEADISPETPADIPN